MRSIEVSKIAGSYLLFREALTPGFVNMLVGKRGVFASPFIQVGDLQSDPL